MKRLRKIGPGALVAAAFIGPGTVTTCTVSGASYGYTLLWAMLFSTLSVILMQSMAARLGIVKQMGLGEALRTRFTKPAARIVLAILVIAAVFIGNVAYETGNVSGAVMGLQAVFPSMTISEEMTVMTKILLTLLVGVIAFWLLSSGSYKAIEKILVALVVLMGVIFLVCAIAIGPDWGQVLKGLFVPSVPQMERGWFHVAGLLGTTVVPYNIYLHASSAAKKWSDGDTAENLKTSNLDSILSIGLGGIISMAIIICASAAFYGTGAEITNGAVMATQLAPLLGSWATVLFGIGLFSAGATSMITAPLAAAFASSGILGWGEDMKKWRFKLIWIIVLLFGVFAVCTIGASPTEIILFAQAANAFLLPVTAILLMVICNSKDFMGQYRNKLWQNILGGVVVAVFIFIAVRNITAFSESFAKLIGG